MTTRTELRHQKKKRKWPKWVLGIFVILLILGSGLLYYIWDKVHHTVDLMHNPLERDVDPERQEALQSLFKNNESINLLLLGVDERAGDKGRSDTMILLSLNPKTNSLVMLSIPRDTRIYIPGHGMDKINHAYAYGGVPLSLQTVEDTFNIPINFYALVNMEGFEDGIDAIGGINVYNKQAFTQDGIKFKEGNIHLNGTEALSYIRMRKNDPQGDIGRNERQREVVQAAINEAASFTTITKIGEILNILGGNVETNLHMDELQQLFLGYRNTRNNIKSLELKGSGQTISGIWYYIVSDTEFNRITTEIKTHMESH
ncbi:MAG TPA: LCP family protein [Candidatus Avamphibacillus sp.]|nr:LCP family protein [Candidatus Avamphibacillus sp.]